MVDSINVSFKILCYTYLAKYMLCKEDRKEEKKEGGDYYFVPLLRVVAENVVTDRQTDRQ